MPTDIVLIHPGAQHGIYGPLAANLTAIEPPTWCRMIAGWLRDRGFSVRIEDQEAEGYGVYDREDAPRLIAIVVSGHQPSASTQQMTSAGDIAGIIKGINPSQKIVMLGNHPSALPVRTIMEESVDYVCDGEGPWTLMGLLNGDDPSKIPGLLWNDGIYVRQNPRAPLIPIAQLHGNVWDLLPMDKYRAHQWQCFGDLSKRQPYASLYTTLGCPHHCDFCMINVFQHTNVYRRRDPIKVVDEIEWLWRVHGVSTLKFADEMFVLHRQHVTDICNELVKRGLGKHLNIWCYSRIDSLFDDLLPLMREAGIQWIALGIESADESVRDGSQKHMDNAAIRDAIEKIHAAGINVIGNFIFGLPGDTVESMQATLDLSMSLNLDFANFYSAMAYPGSKLYDEALAKGLPLPKTWRGYSQHNNESTPLPTATLTSKQIVAFRDAAFNDFFQNVEYLDRMERKFGYETRKHIEGMTELQLVRD